MKIDYKYRYFKTAIQYISRNTFMIGIAYLFEFLILFVHSLESSIILKTLAAQPYLFHFRYFSPFFYFRSYMLGSNENNIFCNYPPANIITIGILVSIYFLYILYFCEIPDNQNQSDKKIQSKFKKIIHFIMINFYEFLFFRVLSVFSIDISINFCFTYAVNSSSYSILVKFASCVPCILLCLELYQHLENYHMWIIFDIKTALPFERDGSGKCDKFLLFIKILLSLELNAQAISFLPVMCTKLMSFAIVVSIVLFALFAISDLLRGYLPFGSSPFFSAFRLLFIIFTATWIIIFLIFDDSFSFLTLSISVFLCLIFWMWYYHLDFYERAFNSNSDIFPKIKLVLSLITSGKSVEDINTTITFHMIQCHATCLFCKKIITKRQKSERNVLSLFDYFKLLFKALNDERKSLLSFDEIAYMELYKIMLQYINQKNILNYKLYLFFSKLMIKYRSTKDSLELNLMLLYEHIRSVNKLSEEYTQFEYIEIISNILLQLKTTLNTFENFLTSHCHSPEDTMKFSEIIFELKNNPNISYLLNKEAEGKYHTFLTRFIFEEIINSPAKSDFPMLREDICMFEDFLNQHFKYDKIMSIKYELINGRLDISRAGSDLLCYSDSPFQNIFPPDFLEAGMIRFHDALSQNKIFDFIIRGPDGNFVELFKIKLKICPGLNAFELWINGEYCFNYEWILVSEVLNWKGKMLEVIYSMSRNIGSLLQLTSDRLSIFRGFDTFFNLQDIMKLHEENINLTKGNKNFELDLEKYLNVYQFTIGIHKDNYPPRQFSIIDNASNSLEELENLKQRSTVILSNKFSFESSGKLYNVYSVRCYNSNQSPDNYNRVSEISLRKLNLSNDDNIRMLNSCYGNTCDELGNAFGSVSLQPSGSSMLGSHISYQINEKYKFKNSTQQKKSERKVKWLALYIILFSAGLIILSISIAIVNLKYNDKLQKDFGTFYNYRGINRLYYHCVLSILCNLCIGEPFSQNCVNQYVLYSKTFSEKRNAKYNIYSYIDTELRGKLSDLLTRIGNFQVELYNLNNNEVSEVFNTKFNFFTLRLVGGKLTYEMQELLFIEALNIYVNFIKAMIEVKGYNSIPVYIITIDSWNHFDFTNVDNKSSLSEFQMNYYNILLNYVRYLQTFEVIGNLLKQQLLKNISTIEFLNLVFTISMIGLHCLLFVLCFIFISSFRGFAMIIMNKMMYRLSKEKYLKILLQKIENLKILCKIYAKNPNEIIQSLQSIYNQASLLYQDSPRKQIRGSEMNVEMTLTPQIKAPTIANQEYVHFQPRDYMFITIRFSKILSAMVIIYILAMSIFYFVLTGSLYQTRIVIQYIDTHNIVENNIFNNFGLIQLMNLSNQTEAMISISLGGNDVQKDSDYITIQIEKTIDMISTLMALEKQHQSYLPQWDSLQWDCKELYSTINDSRIAAISKAFTELNYTGMFLEVCESYPIMAAKNHKLLDIMIEYDSLKLLRKMSGRKYSDMVNMRNMNESFDLYTAILLIYRPLRTYVNQVILNEKLNKASDSLDHIVICYLIVSISGDFCILGILLFFFLRKIKRMNKNLINLEKCLKINK